MSPHSHFLRSARVVLGDCLSGLAWRVSLCARCLLLRTCLGDSMSGRFVLRVFGRADVAPRRVLCFGETKRSRTVNLCGRRFPLWRSGEPPRPWAAPSRAGGHCPPLPPAAPPATHGACGALRFLLGPEHHVAGDDTRCDADSFCCGLLISFVLAVSSRIVSTPDHTSLFTLRCVRPAIAA